MNLKLHADNPYVLAALVVVLVIAIVFGLLLARHYWKDREGRSAILQTLESLGLFKGGRNNNDDLDT